ncbi:MAG TPA: membrane-bound lytic murein transglycosylase MltF [Gammaproteobacteria bacterium]|nr:membrane-bound lytic murein transglycosylase MltF [Gammaproteobacteria bacterium]
MSDINHPPVKARKLRIRRIRLFGIIAALLLSIPLLLFEITEEKTQLEKVQSSGILRVISFNGPTTYYESSHGESGFEYELVKAFADTLDVKLEIVVADRFADIVPEVLARHVDLAAAGLTVTDERSKHGMFTRSYQTIKQQLVYRSGTKRPKNIENLTDRNIVVTSGSSHVERLNDIQAKHPDLSWQEEDDETPENLLVKVWNNEVELTVADSNIISVVKQFYPQLHTAFSLPPDDRLAWLFSRSNDISLLDAANAFLKEAKTSGWLDRLLDRYYGPSSRFNYVNTTRFLDRIEDRLPDYEDMFRRASDETGLDWRLLAAQAYQESHWDANAVSPTGVRGMMMLTRDTASRMKIENRRDPEQSINGGSRYLQLLQDGLPYRIKQPDRMWLALAAYNVGRGHLEDARILAQKDGASPDIWLDVQKYLPLLAKPEWHQNTRHGYARGYEPVQYVNRVRGYYEILSWYDDNRKDTVNVINEIELPAI